MIFTSDDGGTSFVGLPDINRPHRGWKSTFFERGIRVPPFAKWPASIAKGRTFDGAVGHVDGFSPSLPAAGAEVPADRTIDGENLLSWRSREASGAPYESLFWRSGDQKTPLAGDWKLQESGTPHTQ